MFTKENKEIKYKSMNTCQIFAKDLWYRNPSNFVSDSLTASKTTELLN